MENKMSEKDVRCELSGCVWRRAGVCLSKEVDIKVNDEKQVYCDSFVEESVFLAQRKTERQELHRLSRGTENESVFSIIREAIKALDEFMGSALGKEWRNDEYKEIVKRIEAN